MRSREDVEEYKWQLCSNCKTPGLQSGIKVSLVREGLLEEQPPWAELPYRSVQAPTAIWLHLICFFYILTN